MAAITIFTNILPHGRSYGNINRMAEFKIVVTDTLKVEKLDMAVVDTSYRFMYRIVEPVPMHWQPDDIVKVSFALSMIEGNGGMTGVIEKALLERWHKIVNETKRTEAHRWTDQLKWMEEVNKVEIVDCQTIPKE